MSKKIKQQELCSKHAQGLDPRSVIITNQLACPKCMKERLALDKAWEEWSKSSD